MGYLDDLIAKLNQNSTAYTAKTQHQLREEAERKYAPAYDQYRLSANQAYEKSDLAYKQQADDLQSTYDKQRESTAAQYQQAASQNARALLQRGMQRSSYGANVIANIGIKGAKAQDDINTAQTNAQNKIDQNRALAKTQLADQLAGYDRQQQQEILAYMDTLGEREYNRETSSKDTQNNLALQIYQYQHQLEQEAEDKRRWDAQFDAQYGGGSGGGSGGSSGKKNNTSYDMSNISINNDLKNKTNSLRAYSSKLPASKLIDSIKK